MQLSIKMLSSLVTLAFTIVTTLVAYSHAFPVLERAPVEPHTITSTTARSSNTCADPSLARTVLEGFSGTGTAHTLNFHFAFVHTDTVVGSAVWLPQGPAFRAWQTQQPFTVPLFGMENPSGTDIIFMVGPDAETPPVVAGFNVGSPIAWVYDTPVCGSVPLMSAVFASQSDHYYTIDSEEHADLLDIGWADSGVVAFVLPLS